VLLAAATVQYHGVLRVRGNSQKHNPYVLLLHAALNRWLWLYVGILEDVSSRIGSLTVVDSSFILFSVCAASQTFIS